MSYLLDYNPGTPQYTYPRRGGTQLSGTCIIHTAECAMDLDGDDQSAETCARFIANRADYGSYHRLVDSDSIIDMVPFEYEAWQDSETNNWAVGISAAVQAGRWHEIPATRRDRIYRNMASAAAEFVRHMAGRGIAVPLRRITGAEARNRVPGFCAHGDSGLHRSDPGAQFDWNLFFSYTAQALGGIAPAGTITQQGSTTPKEWDEMATRQEVRAEIDAALVTMLDPANDRRAGDGLSWSIWFERMLPGWNGDASAAARIVGTDQAVNDIRAQLGSLHGQVAGLVGALAAVNKGEPFDEAKLLAGVQAAAEFGVKNAIESITVTVKAE